MKPTVAPLTLAHAESTGELTPREISCNPDSGTKKAYKYPTFVQYFMKLLPLPPTEGCLNILSRLKVASYSNGIRRKRHKRK